MPRNYDLEERTAKFGEDIIEFAKEIPKNVVTIPLISQLIRAGTSVGANYCEADSAESRKDFEHKLGISKKEAKESRHWLRMVIKASPELDGKSKRLSQEAHELQLILITIIKNSRLNQLK
ncbi:MAG: four helix bundle protein [Candidatus Sungbacteria bacterium]|uniref:Four helix bundle protein n=1 Tax=Candidatus Sungiibacteriota bacterium TaxID=2750080 RepID=A0A9D6LSA3_9BACT|nr:four helix bundle protein [Candidatus Sungbacteria bacterium]